jgi:hypothetical protein
MNRISAGGASGINNFVDHQVRLARREAYNPHGMVCLSHVQRTDVRIRIDSDGFDTHALAGADHPERYFAAIGDKDTCKHA